MNNSRKTKSKRLRAKGKRRKNRLAAKAAIQSGIQENGAEPIKPVYMGDMVNNDPAWTEFQACKIPTRAEAEAIIRREAIGHYTVEQLEANGCEMLNYLIDDMVKCEIFKNSIYTVTKYPAYVPEGWPAGVIHLSIKRNDRQVLFNWSDMQRLKNEIVGPFHEAVQLFPSEHRLVNCANQYHLFVLDEEIQFPFGFQNRMVANQLETSRSKQDLTETFDYENYKGAAESND